jgi:hypothetical protein
MPMDWIQIVLAPLLMIAGGIVTWFLKSRAEELRAAEQRLTETRRKLYFELLEPYIFPYLDQTPEGRAKVIETVQSKEYRRTVFELNLFASDEVVSAHNRLRKHAFKMKKTGEKNPRELLRLLGALFLEIRRSLGNKKTRLKEFDMLRAMFEDIESVIGD